MFCGCEPLEPRRLLAAADLTGTFVGKIPTTIPIAKKNNAIVAKIVNDGDDAAIGSATLTLHASLDTILDDTDALLTTTKPRNLRLAASRFAGVPIVFASPNIATGDYYLIATIQPDESIAEADATNNSIVTSATVHFQEPFVDLTAVITRSPSKSVTITTGGALPVISVKAVIENEGNIPAKGLLAADVYLSTNEQLDEFDTLVIARPPKNASINAGKVLRLALSAKLPASMPSATYFCIVKVNGDGAITEATPFNNTDTSGQTFTITNESLPPGPAFDRALDADVSRVLLTSPEIVHFAVHVASPSDATVVNLSEFASDGLLIGKVIDLLDDGNAASGDEFANDGVYSGVTTVGFTAAGDRFFAATLSDPTFSSIPQTTPLTISGIAAPTETQLQQDLTDGASLNQLAKNVLSTSGTAQAALDAVADALQSNPNVLAGSIQRSSHAIEWQSTLGILHAVDLSNDPPAGQKAIGSTPLSTPTPSASVIPQAAATIDPAKTAILISPYAYQLAGADDASSIYYPLEAAGYNITNVTNPTDELRNVTIDTFKNLGRYSTVVISTHGGLLPSVGSVLDTGLNGITNVVGNVSDFLNHRLVFVGDHVALTNRFIRTYTGSMNESIVYVSACHSAGDERLANSFLAAGAESFIGYTDVVSSTFASIHGERAFNTLLKPTDNRVNDIPGIDQDKDPAAPHARFVQIGNPRATLPQAAKLKDYDLYIRYSWPQTQTDLDSATSFLGATAGYRYPGGPYLNFSDDNIGSGGEETTRVDLFSAWTAAPWTTTTVTAMADWYTTAGGTGPALISIGLEEKGSSRLIQLTEFSINPDQQTTGATTVVASILVVLGGEATDPTVSLLITPG